MTLEQMVQEAVSDIDGVFGVAAHNWASGERLAIQGDRTFLTASTIKVPILLAALDRVRHGVFDLAQRIPLHADDRVDGSGLLKEFDEGISLTFKDYLTAMIVISDNTATNIVLREVGIPQVNAYLDGLGLTVTRALRPVRSAGPLPGEHRGIGTTTPNEMVAILDKLIDKSILTPGLCGLALDILKRQQYNDGIPRYLPTEAVVACKVGMVNDIRADIGIIYPPHRPPMTLAILVDSLTDRRYVPDNLGWIGIARIAKVIYESWTEE